MQGTQQRQGVSTVGLVVGIVVLLVVGGAIWYFVSDPFKTRMDERYDQLTKWTPENIAKDPIAYLNFAEKKAEEALLDLKADKIRVAQNRATLEDMKKQAENKVRVGETKLKEMVEAYKTGESGDGFPVMYENTKRDKTWMQSNVVSLNKQVEIQRNVASKAEGGLKRLEQQVLKIQQAEGDAQTQIAEIKANRELLKVNKLTDDLKQRLVTMNGVLQGVVSTASEDSSISLDKLASEATTTVDNKEFDKILTNIK